MPRRNAFPKNAYGTAFIHGALSLRNPENVVMWNVVALTVRLAVIAIFALAVFLRGACAENYPQRRVTLIVPHPAGAQADAVARLLADRMSKIWNQPVVVENKVGANGNIGAEAVARAVPDGYTVMLTTTGPLAINTALFHSLDFDPQKDFDPVALVCMGATLIASSIEFPGTRLSDVIALARSEPGQIVHGHRRCRYRRSLSSLPN
jgi:tripartite-type tricarboxylate transporter receptor subunit TctC